ncbi:MAG: hypothetical protein ABIJ46_04905 [bacterium]
MTRFIVILLVVSSAGGCVSSTQFEEMQSEMWSLALQNRALQLQLQARPDAPARPAPAAESEVDRPVASNQPAEQPAPAPERQPVAARPPTGPSPVSQFPPQNWARMYGPPGVPGCDTGPLSVAIDNGTDYYVQAFIDGVEVRVFGGAGTLPHLPPGQTAYACLSRPGRHNVTGVLYVRRGNQLVEVQRFSLDRNFTDVTMLPAMGRQRVHIDRQFLLFH